MSELKTQYKIEVLKEGSGAVEAARDLERYADQAKKTSKANNELASAFKNVLASIAVVSIIRESVRAFAEQEQAIAKLNGTLRASGQFSEDYSQELQDLSSALQEVTQFADENILSVEAQLVAFGAARRDIPKLTEVVLDLAAGMGMDLNSAAMVMGKAIAGEFGTLSRYGVLIDDNATRSEKLAQAIAQLQTRFGGLAREQANTLSGSLQQLKNQIGELGEEIGKLMLESLSPMINLLKDGAKALNEMRAAEEAQSKASLEKMNEKRSALEKQIALLEQQGVITKKLADLERTRLSEAFTPKKEIVNVPLVNPGTGNPITDLFGRLLSGPIVRHDFDASVALGKGKFGPTFGPSVQVETNMQDAAKMSAALAATNRSLAPFLPTPAPPRDLEAEKKAIDDLRKLNNQLIVESLQGFAKDKAAAEVNFQERIRQINELERAGADAEEIGIARARADRARETELAQAEANHRADLIQKAEHKRAEAARRTADEIQAFEQKLTTTALTSSESRVQQAEREYRERIAFADQLYEQYKIGEQQLAEMQRDASFKRVEAIASMAERGRLEAAKLTAGQKGLWEEETIEIKEQFRQRRESIDAYYTQQLDLARGNTDELARIEQQRSEHFEELHRRETRALSQSYQDMVRVIDSASLQFSGGAAHALVESFRGAKNAWSDFAANFLASIGEMIMQMLILRAIQAGLSGLGFHGGGAASFQGGSVAADGGMFPRRMAAGGIAGLMDVSRPTFFPSFNVLAGEAGREVMAVMARPQRMQFGGISAVVGDVQGNKVAMTNAADLARGGVSEVRISLEPGLRAEIIQDSVQGALLKVTQETQRDTTLSKSIRRLSS